MVAFNFKARFAPLVAAGVKRQTIRPKVRAKPGDELQLYTALRTKACCKLLEPDPVCLSVDRCIVGPDCVTIGDVELRGGEADAFAMRDGFENYRELADWFCATHGAQLFIGYLHVWALASSAKPFRSGRAMM